MTQTADQSTETPTFPRRPDPASRAVGGNTVHANHQRFAERAEPDHAADPRPRHPGPSAPPATAPRRKGNR